MIPVATVRSSIVGPGGLILNGSENVFVNNKAVGHIGSVVSPHPCCGSPGCGSHCLAFMVGVKPATVFVNNIIPTRLGDVASCGDPVIIASLNVFFG